MVACIANPSSEVSSLACLFVGDVGQCLQFGQLVWHVSAVMSTWQSRSPSRAVIGTRIPSTNPSTYRTGRSDTVRSAGSLGMKGVRCQVTCAHATNMTNTPHSLDARAWRASDMLRGTEGKRAPNIRRVSHSWSLVGIRFHDGDLCCCYQSCCPVMSDMYQHERASCGPPCGSCVGSPRVLGNCCGNHG
jgi:hypothetical protein